MTDDASHSLALEGGTPLFAEPWPAPPEVAPASDGDPVAVLEATLAERLDLPADKVVAFGAPSEAYRAVLGTPVPTRDEVIVPALFAQAAAEAARAAGWRVVLAEVEADTGALSARGLARAASERSGLVVVAHPSGHPAPMDELGDVAEARGFPLVEEASGALGASYRELQAGRFGRASVVRCSEGDPVSRGTFAIFAGARDAAAARTDVRTPLAEADAAVALAELRRLDEELLWRQRLAWELTLALRGARALSPMPHGRWVRHAYPRYVVRLRSRLWRRGLEDTVRAIRAEGVPCEPASIPSLPEEDRVREDMHPAVRLAKELIAIPLHSGLTSRQVELVAAVLRKVEARSV